MLFISTFKLVDGLLRAKEGYDPESELPRLDRLQVIIADDMGYVQQGRQDMEVVLTFLPEWYQRLSGVMTSNLVFSDSDQIFKDPSPLPLTSTGWFTTA